MKHSATLLASVRPGSDKTRLAASLAPVKFSVMNTTELLEQIEGLPNEEKARLIERLHANAPSWIPESFREGMADIAAGRSVGLDDALTRPPTGQ